MPGSEYGNIPFADDIKAMIDLLDEKILSLTTTIASLETDLEGYGFDFLFKQWDFIPSTDLLKSDDAEVSQNNLPWVKKKEITFNPSPDISVRDSSLSIKWQLKCSLEGGYTAKSKIYINGVAESGEINTVSTVYVDKNYTISGLNIGDKIQLYLCTISAEWTAYARNFRIYGKTEGVVYPEPTW